MIASLLAYALVSLGLVVAGLLALFAVADRRAAAKYRELGDRGVLS